MVLLSSVYTICRDNRDSIKAIDILIEFPSGSFDCRPLLVFRTVNSFGIKRCKAFIWVLFLGAICLHRYLEVKWPRSTCYFAHIFHEKFLLSDRFSNSHILIMKGSKPYCCLVIIYCIMSFAWMLNCAGENNKEVYINVIHIFNLRDRILW